MDRLKSHDYHDVLNLIYVCNSYLDTSSFREGVLPALLKVFHAEGGGFFLFTQDLKSLDFTNIVSLGIDEFYNKTYAQHYWRCDPHLQKALHSKTVAFKSDDILPVAEWLKLEYYSDFLRPQNMKQELDICLRSGNKLFGLISLLRSRYQRNFHDRDMLIAKILAPHLTSSLRNAILFSKIDEERKLLRAGSEFLTEGIILLDCELRPLYYNSKAKKICLYLCHKRVEPTNGVEGEELPVPSEVLQDCLVLKRQFQDGSLTDPIQHQRIISAEHDKTVYIECFAVGQPSQISHTPYFLVSLEDFSKMPMVNQDIIQEKYYLTNREMEIIHCVADGLTNSEIAENLFVSKLTVETHLRNIFKKTGVRNRTELANLIKPAWRLPRDKQGDLACPPKRSPGKMLVLD